MRWNMVDIWKYTTFLFIFVSIALAITSEKILFLKEQITPQDTIAPASVLNEESSTDKKTQESGFPTNSFFISQGKVWIDETRLYSDENFFVVALENNALSEEKVTHKYKVPISDMDYIYNPKLSHSYEYGCTTIGASGYTGYYIFHLPDGKKLAQGIQYSECIEWIDSNRVIVLERDYDRKDYVYYILSVPSMKKQTISTAKLETLKATEFPPSY